MELKEALLKRRSVRKYTEEVVSKEDIDELMHAAMSGPSACNTRPWEFYVVQDPIKVKEVIKCMKFANYGANTVIIVAGNLHHTVLMPGLKEFWVQDCSAATENILLRATDLGLGTVWCGVYPNKKLSDKIKEVIGAKNHIIPLNVILVGHPNEEPESRDQYDERKIHFVTTLEK
ncbi:MAG: nitroreductase family protein [Bacilli bacterium]|nr:nitroreductase family protein [Bacilli bacterium]